MDVHDPKTRSYNMSRIRNIDTKPEMIVRRFLYHSGVRYRIHDKRLPGKPDISIWKKKIAIFINGCFWHGHKDCKYFKLPQTNRDWWKDKIEKTRENDKKVIESLHSIGWNTIEIFECELKNKSRDKRLEKLLVEVY